MPVERLDAVAEPAEPAAAPASAPPTPSSATSSADPAAGARDGIVTLDACACLATLASASDATKYAAASTGAASRSSGTALISTGTVARRASEASAAATALRR